MPRPFLVLLCIFVATGLFLRFYDIDRKVYWDDEIFSSLHMLGYTEGEVVAGADRIVDGRALRAVLHPGHAALRKGVPDTLRALASDDPQHSPLYYVAGNLWLHGFGDSSAAIRCLSALVGVAALPCMFWLCLELFGSSLAAWMGTALLAMSPFEVLYSQEAREYSLWSLAILLMSAAFLRAIRLGTREAWALYAVALTLGLYSFLLSALVALGNLLYVLVTQQRDLRSRYYAALATVGGLVAFLPWLTIVVRGRDQIAKGMATIISVKASPPHIARQFLTMLRLTTFDFNLVHHAAINVMLTVPALLLLAYCGFELCRQRNRNRALFVAVTIASCAVPLVALDLLFSGQRTDNPRYFVPLFIGIDLAIVGAFFTKFTSVPGRRGARPKLWRAAFTAVLCARLLSDAASAKAETWWTKRDQQAIAVARAINRTPRPIVIGNDYVGWALSLANYVRPGVRFELRPRCYLCSNVPRHVDLGLIQPPNDYSDVFLLAPSATLQRRTRDVMTALPARSTYHCIDVRSNCASALSLW